MLSINTMSQIIFYLAILINAAIFIPQIMQLLKNKDARNVSVTTFFGFLLLQLIIVFHGISIGDVVIITGYLLSTIACAIVVVLTLFYKLKRSRALRLNQEIIVPEGPCYQETLERLDLLENIIAIMPGHVYWMSKDGVYLGCNDAQAKSAGFASRHDIVGMRSKDAPWAAGAEGLADAWEAVNAQVMSQGKVMIVEEPAVHLDGSSATYLSNKAPIYNRQQEMIGMVGISIDITERKKIEQDLIKAKADAAANQAKTEFLYNMKHDLRTPFSGILGIAEFMESTEDNPEKKENLGYIAQSARVMLTHLNEIFEFINANQGALPILYKQFEIRTVLQDVHKMLLPAAKEKNIDFNLVIDEQLPQFLIGDSVRTQRILMNLASNAIKFTHTGKVDIAAELAKENDNKLIVKFTVFDTGVGIPEDKHHLIFEQFNRLTSSYSGNYPGKGLGLRMTKHFLDEIQGEISVVSEINQGSIFKVLIPYRPTLLNCPEEII